MLCYIAFVSLMDSKTVFETHSLTFTPSQDMPGFVQKLLSGEASFWLDVVVIWGLKWSGLWARSMVWLRYVHVGFGLPSHFKRSNSDTTNKTNSDI